MPGLFCSRYCKIFEAIVHARTLVRTYCKLYDGMVNGKHEAFGWKIVQNIGGNSICKGFG